MTTMAEIRERFPDYESIPDGDLLMALHKEFYPKAHIKDFMEAIDGAENAHATIKDSAWRDYWVESVSKPRQGETDQDLRARLIGTMEGPIGSSGGQAMTSVRSGFQGMTLGAGDEIIARLVSISPNRTYDQELQRERDRLEIGRQEFPKTALTSEIVGAVALPLGAGTQLAKGAPLIQKGAAAMAGGGLLGYGYGFNQGEGGFQERAKAGRETGIMSGLLSFGIPFAGAGIQKGMNALKFGKGMRAAVKSAPTTAESRAAAKKVYKKIKDMDVQIKGSSFDKARTGIVDDLLSETAYSTRPGGKTMTPKAAAVVGDMAEMSSEMAQGKNPAVPFREIESLRRQAGAAASNVLDAKDQQAGMRIIKGLDDFIDGLKKSDVISGGDVKKLPKLINKARKLYAKSAKSQKIDDAMATAETYKYGFQKGIKSQFGAILRSKKASRGFNAAEKKTMQRVIAGSVPERVLEHMGSGLASIGGMAGGLYAAASAGPSGLLAGGAVMGASMLARGASNKIARKQASNVRRIMASGQAAEIPMIGNTLPAGLLESALRGATPAASARFPR